MNETNARTFPRREFKHEDTPRFSIKYFGSDNFIVLGLSGLFSPKVPYKILWIIEVN